MSISYCTLFPAVNRNIGSIASVNIETQGEVA
jgi:hypothetical protein